MELKVVGMRRKGREREEGNERVWKLVRKGGNGRGSEGREREMEGNWSWQGRKGIGSDVKEGRRRVSRKWRGIKSACNGKEREGEREGKMKEC